MRFGNGDVSPRLVEIPLREDAGVEPAESFAVELAGHPRCGALGGRRRAAVTIVDDDGPQTPPPPPAFTLGGAVDGLRGSGLVLTDRGTDLGVLADGAFTLPGTASRGRVRTTCRSARSRTLPTRCAPSSTAPGLSANVTDVVVHCETPALPSGLDGRSAATAASRRRSAAGTARPS